MKKAVIKATGLVFILSLVAKLIGFVKSMIEASYYGASLEMDAYNVSSGFVSNILYMLTTAIAVAFVPIYIQHKSEKDERKRFATRTITFLCLIALLLTAILILLAPLVTKIIAPSFGANEKLLATGYFRVLAIGIVFSLMANLFSSVLNAEKRFGFSTVSSVINSIVLITFIVGFSKSMGVWALVVAMPVSFFVQWIVQYMVGRRYATISFRYGLKDESIKLLILQAAPVLLSQATVEINQVVDRALLSGVEIGALTAVSYSAVLYQFVTTLISMPVSTVMFTELSEAGAEKNKSRIASILNDSFHVLILISIPIMAISFICSTDIVSFIYGRGRFDENAIRQCAEGLRMYVLCLLPVSIKSVLVRAYYSLNDTKRPMVFGMLEVALNIILSILLVKQFGIMGVVGATAIASYVFIVIMLYDYNHKYVTIINKKTLAPYWKICIGFLAVAGILLITNYYVQLAPLPDFIIKAFAGFIIYFGVLLIMKEDTLVKILDVVRSKVKKKAT